MTYTNGLTTDISYNEDNFRLNRISTNALQDLYYDYDQVGNLVWILDAIHNSVYNLGYDNLDRLIHATRSGGISFDISYVYDKIGNILQINHNEGEMDFDYADRAYTPQLVSSTPQLLDIISNPPQWVFSSRIFYYEPFLSGIDENSELEFYLIKGPPSAAYINNILTWTPDLYDSGETFNFEIRVVDTMTQRSANQSFQVEVRDITLNILPVPIILMRQSENSNQKITDNVFSAQEAIQELQHISSENDQKKHEKKSERRKDRDTSDHIYETVSEPTETHVQFETPEYNPLKPQNKQEDIKEQKSFIVRIFKGLSEFIWY